MPITKDLPNEWYNTPNLHMCTIKDLFHFCLEKRIKINRKKWKNNVDDYKLKLSAADDLLKKCRKFGAIHFSAIARLAFVARILLYGLIDVSEINKKDIEKRKLPRKTTPLEITEIQKKSPNNFLKLNNTFSLS